MKLLYVGAKLSAFLPRWLQIKFSGEPPVIVDGQQLDPQVQLLRALRKRRVRYGLVEPTVEAGRTRYRRETAIFNPRPTRVGAVRDLDVAGMRARLYSPLDLRRPGGWPEGVSPSGRRDAAHPSGEDAGAPLTVYFHGGGFVIGDLDTHDEPCRMLCRHSGSHVLSVAYRLAPEHPFPTAVKMRWLRFAGRARMLIHSAPIRAAWPWAATARARTSPRPWPSSTRRSRNRSSTRRPTRRPIARRAISSTRDSFSP